MLSEETLREIEQRYPRRCPSFITSGYQDLLILIDEVRDLRAICGRVVEASGCESPENAMMEFKVIAEEIRNGNTLEV